MAPASDFYEEVQCGEAQVEDEEPAASEKQQNEEDQSGPEAAETAAEEDGSNSEESADEGSQLLPSSPARKANSGGPVESQAADLSAPAPAPELDGWAAWKKKDLKDFAHPDNKDDWKKEELVDMDFWRMPLTPLSP